jgi:16S rRNA (guanine527-N7)-methyltransferase
MIADDVQLLKGTSVSRETDARLHALADLVIKWTSRINLISSSSVSDIWVRHVIDSAQLYAMAPAKWKSWADVGSGGGFPGMVIAVIAAELNPDGRVTLIESDQRKSVFLRTAIRELGIETTVVAGRIESMAPLGADVLSARALGVLADLLPIAHRHLAPNGQAIFPKGRKADDEVKLARTAWQFDIASQPSSTDPDAQVLMIKNICHV